MSDLHEARDPGREHRVPRREIAQTYIASVLAGCEAVLELVTKTAAAVHATRGAHVSCCQMLKASVRIAR